MRMAQNRYYPIFDFRLPIQAILDFRFWIFDCRLKRFQIFDCCLLCEG
jgi:hypothetical protein